MYLDQLTTGDLEDIARDEARQREAEEAHARAEIRCEILQSIGVQCDMCRPSRCIGTEACMCAGCLEIPF